MQKIIIITTSILCFSLISCRKDYVCVCTVKVDGSKSYGDRFKAGPITKKAAEESCKSNDDVFSDGLENCHLE